jgi:NADH dehydrogenase
MKRIVILGSGFGGMEAAVGLDKLFHHTRGVEILIISEQNHFLFTPLLPQIASSYINPRHIVQTVRDLRNRRRFRFRRDTVHSIDLENRRIQLTADAVEYDYLVIALGSHTEYFNVSGAREHTWDFKSLEDAVVLRERIIDACEHADHTADPAERRRYLTFIVVGGGYTGVELLAEMRDFMFGYVAKKYRGIPREEIRLILLEAGQTILNGVHPSLRKHALRRLQGEGIEIRYNASVTRCFEGGVEIGGKEIIDAGTVAWAAGVRAHELVEKLPGPHDRIGRALLNQYLQYQGHPEVFVIGDSAAAADATDAPRVAPVAISQGRIAARNIGHLERNEPLETYRYVSQGMLVSLGMNDAVVNIAGLRIHGYFAWLFWNAVHLYKLVGLKKQLQVALDWSLSMLFPRDAAIVRRPQGCKICAAQSK